MIIPPRTLHDLKTERSDISPPLAAWLRLVPIAFYASAVASIALAAWSVVELRNAQAEKAQLQARAGEANAKLAEIALRRTELEGQAKRASDFVAWIDGSRSVQPLVTTIARSISESSGITELALDRTPETPSQIKLTLRLLTEDADQLDRTLDAISRADFRAYSATQSQSGGRIDYEATLIWQPGGVAAAETE